MRIHSGKIKIRTSLSVYYALWLAQSNSSNIQPSWLSNTIICSFWFFLLSSICTLWLIQEWQPLDKWTENVWESHQNLDEKLSFQLCQNPGELGILPWKAFSPAWMGMPRTAFTTWDWSWKSRLIRRARWGLGPAFLMSSHMMPEFAGLQPLSSKLEKLLLLCCCCSVNTFVCLTLFVFP